MTKVVVTGAAGFIGSNLVHRLNAAGVDDVIAVDDLTDGAKFVNLRGAKLADYLDQSEFYDRFAAGRFGRIDAVLHQGACSDTMQTDGRFMMERNFGCSKRLLEACAEQGTRLLYASSAAVYGGGSVFREERAFERPLNVYGYSKWLFDEIVRRHLLSSRTQVVGLRYFNVYGPREQHKGRMGSVAFHHFNQFREQGVVRLFGEYGGYGPGAHSRDFVHVDDVASVIEWFLDHPQTSGIYNLGSGRSQPFNDVACAVVNRLERRDGEASSPLHELVANGRVAYIPFPDSLAGRYQCHTQADLSALRAAGCTHEFADVSTGVARYVDWLGSELSAG